MGEIQATVDLVINFPTEEVLTAKSGRYKAPKRGVNEISKKQLKRRTIKPPSDRGRCAERAYKKGE